MAQYPTSDTDLLLSARVAAYRMMQALFGREPQADVVASLASPEFAQVVCAFCDEDANGAESGAEDLPARVEALQAAAGRCADGGETALSSLADGYARLFVGPRRPEAAPWESAYVGEDDTLFQPCTITVRKAYVAEGLIPAKYPRIADDHLAIELGFLASLGERAQAAYEAGDVEVLAANVASSQAFLDEHLLRWLPELCDALENATRSDVYAEAGRVLEAFAQADRRFLDEVTAV